MKSQYTKASQLAERAESDARLAQASAQTSASRQSAIAIDQDIANLKRKIEANDMKKVELSQ